MKIVLFCHSILSDWNHGNAHFLRGIATELLSRGHDLQLFEPRDNWSLQNLLQDGGEPMLDEFYRVYPLITRERIHRYDLETLDLPAALHGADLVLVHEWNDPALVARIGAERERGGGFRLFFHDTHHRAATAPHEMAAFDLRHYDGVLAFGNVIRDLYLQNRWHPRVWTWHEAADVRVFRPLEGLGSWVLGLGDEVATASPNQRPKTQDPRPAATGDLVWIGNWGDDERARELSDFLIEPARELGLRALVHGVRYPDQARAALSEAGIEFGGWLPNFLAPRVFARHRVTVHVPRRPYVEALPGIPTIRPFEALACGIPLVCAPWHDVEGLFSPGQDFLVARDTAEMQRHLRAILDDPALAHALAAHGLQTIHARHTCAHRVDELLDIIQQI